MNAIVPDTFQGAVILSVIDFFLSFLIISGIGFVLSLFPLLNKMPTCSTARRRTRKPRSRWRRRPPLLPSRLPQRRRKSCPKWPRLPRRSP